jgi:hypothetical protein
MLRRYTPRFAHPRALYAYQQAHFLPCRYACMLSTHASSYPYRHPLPHALAIPSVRVLPGPFCPGIDPYL